MEQGEASSHKEVKLRLRPWRKVGQGNKAVVAWIVGNGREKILRTESKFPWAFSTKVGTH